jgi:hypothetical protein
MKSESQYSQIAATAETSLVAIALWSHRRPESKAPEDRRSPKPVGILRDPPTGFGLRLSSGAFDRFPGDNGGTSSRLSGFASPHAIFYN